MYVCRGRTRPSCCIGASLQQFLYPIQRGVAKIEIPTLVLLPICLICRSPGNQQHYNGGIYFISSHSVVSILLDISTYSFRSLSYHRSIASARVRFSTECDLVHPLLTSSIFSFPLHDQQLLISSSLSSHHLYPSLCLSYSLFYKAVPMQDVSNPVSLLLGYSCPLEHTVAI